MATRLEEVKTIKVVKLPVRPVIKARSDSSEIFENKEHAEVEDQNDASLSQKVQVFNSLKVNKSKLERESQQE